MASAGKRAAVRLTTDPRAEFPGVNGLSRANRFHMRRLAGVARRRSWPSACCSTALGHITLLLDRLADHELRDWYADQAARRSWSRRVLAGELIAATDAQDVDTYRTTGGHMEPAASAIVGVEESAHRDDRSCSAWRVKVPAAAAAIDGDVASATAEALVRT